MDGQTTDWPLGIIVYKNNTEASNLGSFSSCLAPIILPLLNLKTLVYENCLSADRSITCLLLFLLSDEGFQILETSCASLPSLRSDGGSLSSQTTTWHFAICSGGVWWFWSWSSSLRKGVLKSNFESIWENLQKSAKSRKKTI